MNKINKGNYYKLKTKKWLQADGYEVGSLETNQRLFIKGRMIFIKRDLWGADLIAKNDKEMIFIQCKTNKGDVNKGLKELNTTVWPAFIKRWVVIWPLRAREPEVVSL
jgi:hypothetical protein